MPSSRTTHDVIVAGAGAGGICAALSAGRNGARVLLLEKSPAIGGTGVHSPVSLVCKFHGSDHRPINMGIHRELFPVAYLHSTRDHRPSARRLTYDECELAETYRSLLAAESRIEVRVNAAISEVECAGRHLSAVILADGARASAPVFIDSTADGNLSALAGCECMKGRDKDGALQSATLTFTLGRIDKALLRVPEFSTSGGLLSLWGELTPLFKAAKARGETSNPKSHVVAFPYPDGDRLLFNSNEMTGVDPTVPGSVEAAFEMGRRFVEEMVAIFRRDHPAFARCEILQISPWLGVREGRRVLGDYVLTEEDCLSAARFPDMVAACAYSIDIHDPEGGETRLVDIPVPGYYHIPYRSLIARDADNLLLGSRCISGTHEAHSSYRVISGVTAIGEAAGAASFLAARLSGGDVRAIPASMIRHVLRRQVQFVEGDLTAPPAL